MFYFSCYKFCHLTTFSFWRMSSLSFTISGTIPLANSSQSSWVTDAGFQVKTCAKYHLSNFCKVMTWVLWTLSAFPCWDFAKILSIARDFQTAPSCYRWRHRTKRLSDISKPQLWKWSLLASFVHFLIIYRQEEEANFEKSKFYICEIYVTGYTPKRKKRETES